jgi:hypothetical protein
MKHKLLITAASFCLAFCAGAVAIEAQTDKLIKRTTYKSDTLDFGMGGTVTVVGAPKGSIEIEGWQKNQLEVSAEIEIEAGSEADLTRLSEVNGFVLDESFGHVRITSVGTNDKEYMRRIDKKFPKHLIGVPFRVNYKIKVPRYTDLNINGGIGDLILAGVDGEIKISFRSTNAKMTLIGGSVNATFGDGTVDLSILSRSWRGRFADIQLASGTMNVNLPLSFDADIEATILQSGKIENSLAALKPKPRTKFTDTLVAGKVGSGGVALTFTVGNGAVNLSELKKPE